MGMLFLNIIGCVSDSAVNYPTQTNSIAIPPKKSSGESRSYTNTVTITPVTDSQNQSSLDGSKEPLVTFPTSEEEEPPTIFYSDDGSYQSAAENSSDVQGNSVSAADKKQASEKKVNVEKKHKGAKLKGTVDNELVNKKDTEESTDYKEQFNLVLDELISQDDSEEIDYKKKFDNVLDELIDSNEDVAEEKVSLFKRKGKKGKKSWFSKSNKKGSSYDKKSDGKKGSWFTKTFKNDKKKQNDADNNKKTQVNHKHSSDSDKNRSSNKEKQSSRADDNVATKKKSKAPQVPDTSSKPNEMPKTLKKPKINHSGNRTVVVTPTNGKLNDLKSKISVAKANGLIINGRNGGNGLNGTRGLNGDRALNGGDGLNGTRGLKGANATRNIMNDGNRLTKRRNAVHYESGTPLNAQTRNQLNSRRNVLKRTQPEHFHEEYSSSSSDFFDFLEPVEDKIFDLYHDIKDSYTGLKDKIFSSADEIADDILEELHATQQYLNDIVDGITTPSLWDIIEVIIQVSNVLHDIVFLDLDRDTFLDIKSLAQLITYQGKDLITEQKKV